MEVTLEPVQRAEDLIAILFKDFYPHGRIAGRDTGGVFQTIAGKLTPLAGTLAEQGAEVGGEDLR